MYGFWSQSGHFLIGLCALTAAVSFHPPVGAGVSWADGVPVALDDPPITFDELAEELGFVEEWIRDTPTTAVVPRKTSLLSLIIDISSEIDRTTLEEFQAAILLRLWREYTEPLQGTDIKKFRETLRRWQATRQRRKEGLREAAPEGSARTELERLWEAICGRQRCIMAVRFNSGGGDVSAAIKLGEQIRIAKSIAVVPKGASCASACVLAFLGGVIRAPFGKIGLHRPFAVLPSDSGEQARANRVTINKIVGDYLTRMNIPSRLLDEMNAISPGTVRWLHGERDLAALTELQIFGKDPVYSDEEDSEKAKELGISMREFYSRLQNVERLCGEMPAGFDQASIRWWMCRTAVMEGRLP